ncbi:hypothetical protein [Paenibacillus flagellatus]|uniref:Glycosyltransferase RgtA/B/C/D-like domain-containing protein n=1 Tax=Paenibacillus flagellatus TaxID=2211139 RepID=A0A2V5JY38_9BACL|nr:hypothetical protein [Paenibacillus flagellatus]PYI50174.1 hypothetical protein DLM86_30850 [Paenibacillus flagellatus]
MNAKMTRQAVWSIILLIAISRAVMVLTGYMGMNLFASYTEAPTYEQRAPGVVPDYSMNVPTDLADTRKPKLTDFVKFDSFAYLKIATRGYDAYRIDEPHPPANWVFFPLYPLLIFALGQVVGLGLLEPAVVGMIVSNACLAAAFFYIYRFAMGQGLSEGQSRSVLVLMLAYPTSLFYSLPYTESLFLLLSAASLYYATNKRYALAFMAASLSTVTRVPGFINLFFVVGSVLLNEGFRWNRRYWRWGLYAVLSLVPMGLYLLYMKRLTGDYLAPFHEQSLSWYRFTAAPFANYVHYFEKPYFMAPGGWDNGFIAFIVSTLVFAVYLLYLILGGKPFWRSSKQWLLWVYGALLIVIPFSSQPWYLASVVRYMMVCIPLFLYVIKLTEKRDHVRFAILWVFLFLNAITTIAFFNDYYFMA